LHICKWKRVALALPTQKGAAKLQRGGWGGGMFRWRSVADPHHIDVRILYTPMWIRILFYTLMRIQILSFALTPNWIIFGADPDPKFRSDAELDHTVPFNLMRIQIRILPLTLVQIWTLQCSKMSLHLFTLIRIRILLFTLMRIRSGSRFPLCCGS